MQGVPRRWQLSQIEFWPDAKVHRAFLLLHSQQLLVPLRSFRGVTLVRGLGLVNGVDISDDIFLGTATDDVGSSQRRLMNFINYPCGLLEIVARVRNQHSHSILRIARDAHRPSNEEQAIEYEINFMVVFMVRELPF